MNFEFLLTYYPYYIDGLWITLSLSILGVVMGAPLGLLIGLARLSDNFIIKRLAVVYIEFIRGTPLLLQLYVIVYGLPALFPNAFSGIPDFFAGVMALVINSSGYTAEIFRAGIQSVDKGQMEGARSLGISSVQALKFIIIPQAIKNIIPALGNEFITLTKDSSIVAVIGVGELMYKTTMVRTSTYLGFEPLIVAALVYFTITFSLSKIMIAIEKRLHYERRK